MSASPGGVSSQTCLLKPAQQVKHEAAPGSDTHTLCKALLLDLHKIKRKKSNEGKSLVFPGAVGLFLSVSPVYLGLHHCRFLVSAWGMG